MENKINSHLYSLNDTNYQVVDGEPNITGWKVENEDGNYIGKVVDLLFEADINAVRYLVIDLSENGMSIDHKVVIIPIGLAQLQTANNEVILPNIHFEQYAALPPYKQNVVTPEMEMEIRRIIGSPAALRLEGEIMDFDRKQFYAHHNFSPSKLNANDRAKEESTIHSLVEQSKSNNLNAAGNVGEGTHHNEHHIDGANHDFKPGEHEIKPWLQPGAASNQGGSEKNPDNQP